MQQTIKEQIESEANRPVFTSVTMWQKDNYVNFSDTDSQTDYFHGYSLGINHLIEWITVKNLAQPATVVHVSAGNNEVQPKYIKRLEKLAKVLNYKVKQVHKKGIYRIGESTDYYSHAPCYNIRPYDYIEWYLYDASLVKESEIVTQ